MQKRAIFSSDFPFSGVRPVGPPAAGSAASRRSPFSGAASRRSAAAGLDGTGQWCAGGEPGGARRGGMESGVVAGSGQCRQVGRRAGARAVKRWWYQLSVCGGLTKPVGVLVCF